jgi:hypothetical protein
MKDVCIIIWFSTIAPSAASLSLHIHYHSLSISRPLSATFSPSSKLPSHPAKLSTISVNS